MQGIMLLLNRPDLAAVRRFSDDPRTLKTEHRPHITPTTYEYTKKANALLDHDEQNPTNKPPKAACRILSPGYMVTLYQHMHLSLPQQPKIREIPRFWISHQTETWLADYEYYVRTKYTFSYFILPIQVVRILVLSMYR